MEDKTIILLEQCVERICSDYLNGNTGELDDLPYVAEFVRLIQREEEFRSRRGLGIVPSHPEN